MRNRTILWHSKLTTNIFFHPAWPLTADFTSQSHKTMFPTSSSSEPNGHEFEVNRPKTNYRNIVSVYRPPSQNTQNWHLFQLFWPSVVITVYLNIYIYVSYIYIRLYICASGFPIHEQKPGFWKTFSESSLQPAAAIRCPDISTIVIKLWHQRACNLQVTEVTRCWGSMMQMRFFCGTKKNQLVQNENQMFHTFRKGIKTNGIHPVGFWS